MTANEWAAVIFAALWFGVVAPVMAYCVWRDIREKEARRHR